MLDIVKIPTIGLFVGPPGVGKSQLVLHLLENEYLHYFEKIVFICPTITINKTYIASEFIWKDQNIYTIKPNDDDLLGCIERLSKVMTGLKTLFIVDDCIADKGFDKNRGALVNLAITVRHRNQMLFLLTQNYTSIPKKFRRLSTMTFIWFLKDKDDIVTIAKEHSFIENCPQIFKTLQESASKHIFAYIRGEKPFSVTIKEDGCLHTR